MGGGLRVFPLLPRFQATVTLPKLFKWYSMDFGENENEVLNWVESRAGGELKEKIGMVSVVVDVVVVVVVMVVSVVV